MFIPLHDSNALKHIRLQFVTLTLIAINILVWLLIGTPAISDAQAVQQAYYAYGFIPAVANNLQTLPLEVVVIPSSLNYVSYAFFHGDFMHLAGNMLFLWVFGDNVEDAMGHIRYLIFYVACAAAGAWFHAFMAPDSSVPLIGASAAAAGIVAAYLMLHPNVRVWVLALGRIPLRIPALWAIGAWIAFQLYNLIANPGDEVSWAAHVGGIIAGAILLPLLKRSDVPLFERTDTNAKDTETHANTNSNEAPENDLPQAEVPSPHKSPSQIGQSPPDPPPNQDGKWGRQ